MPVCSGGWVNSVGVKDRKKYFIRPRCPPPPPPKGHFELSPVSLASKDQDINDQHVQSHGKIGDCEQSILLHP